MFVDVQSQDSTVLQSTITGDGGSHPLYVRSDEVAQARMPGDAWLCAALLPAMRLRAALELNSVVSNSVMSGCQDIQRTVSQWDWDLDVISIKAESITSGNSRAEGVGCFFSGGVDSSLSAIRRPDVTHLITVLGFDVSLDSKWLAERVVYEKGKAASELRERADRSRDQSQGMVREARGLGAIPRGRPGMHCSRHEWHRGARIHTLQPLHGLQNQVGIAPIH